VKIQILSDLHNEFLRSNQSTPSHHWRGVIPIIDADIVVLAGDIDTGKHGAQWAIKESVRLSKPIVYVLGNHEFYRNEYNALRNEISQLCNGTDVHYLDCDVFIHEDIRVIGATLWTDYEINPHVQKEQAMAIVEKNPADHRLIEYQTSEIKRRFMPMDALSIHNKELRWIEEQLLKPFKGKTMIVTHHGPHPVCQHPGFPMSEITTAFHSDLSKLIDMYDIDVWVYGHTHSNIDEHVLNTRIVSNQAGYPGENVKDFDDSFVLTL